MDLVNNRPMDLVKAAAAVLLTATGTKWAVFNQYSPESPGLATFAIRNKSKNILNMISKQQLHA